MTSGLGPVSQPSPDVRERRCTRHAHPPSTLQDRKQEKAGELPGADKPEGSPSPSPHTSSGSSSEEEDDAPAPGLSPPNTAGGRRPEEEEEDDDVLKYVREIFFS